MLSVEVNSLLARLQELWPKGDWTDAIIDEWSTFLARYNAEQAKAAISLHRQESDRLNPRIGAVAAKLKIIPGGDRTERHANGWETIRGHMVAFAKKLGRHELAETTRNAREPEVWLRNYRWQWFKAKNDIEQSKAYTPERREWLLASHRTHFRTQAYGSLIACGVDPAFAEGAAEMVYAEPTIWDAAIAEAGNAPMATPGNGCSEAHHV